jgi:hypothetical protein
MNGFPLESKIDKILEEEIRDDPPSINDAKYPLSSFDSTRALGAIGATGCGPLLLSRIHEIIDESPLVECLTSPSEYIREYASRSERKINVIGAFNE